MGRRRFRKRTYSTIGESGFESHPALQRLCRQQIRKRDHTMSKKKKPRHKSHTIMGRSDIPYAQRLALHRQTDIVANREHAAKIVMFCESIALHDVEGIGYKRLVRYSLVHRELIDEFYEDIEVGMDRARRRMQQIGMPVSGQFFQLDEKDESAKHREIMDHRLQASQIALFCSKIAIHEVFGFAWQRQERLSDRSRELSARYAKEGEGFLLEELQKIGFPIVNGKIVAYTDEDGNAILPSKVNKEPCNS